MIYFLLIFRFFFQKAIVRGEIEKSGVADHIWKEKGNHLPLSDKVEIIDRIRLLKESAHMLGYNDLLSRPSIELNAIWETIISSFLLLFPQRFGRYVLRPSGLRITSFIETTGVACSNSISRVQVLSIPVLYRPQWGLNLQPSDDCLLRTNAYNRYAMCPAGQFRVNFLL